MMLGAPARPGIASRLRRWAARLDAAIDEPVDVGSLVVLRVALGPIVLLHLQPFLALAREGVTYRDRFHVPFASWYPEVPDPVYLALLWLAVPAAVALSVGFSTRAAAIYTATFVGYNLFLTKTHFHHNRAFLLVILVGVALLPTGATRSVDALRSRRAGRAEPRCSVRWPLMLLRFQVAAVYTASGFSKLVDADWWGGVVTQLRVERYGQVAVDRGVPEWLVDLAAAPGFHAGFAKVVVLTELFIGLGLLVPRIRLAALWVAIPFHLAIQATASVQVFTLAALAALFIWVTPVAPDRTVWIGSRRLAAIVRGLDWAARFDVRLGSSAGWGVVVADRDGTRLEGKAAALALLSRLPATFWFAAPIRLVTEPRRATKPPPSRTQHGRSPGSAGSPP
jgi:hypothetical protein